jgi:hypothetical protein
LYSFWIFPLCYSLLFLLSFLISYYSSLLILLFLPRLILLVGAILRLLILLFLYFNCLLYYRHAWYTQLHISIILRVFFYNCLLYYRHAWYTHILHCKGFFKGAKPFLIHLGSIFMYIPVRPYVLIFVLFFFINIMSPPSYRSFADPYGVINDNIYRENPCENSSLTKIRQSIPLLV